MKTRIYLPVLTMLTLMLFSFTINKNSKSSIKELANGNYLLQNVPLEKGDILRLDQMAAGISGNFNEDTALGFIYRNKTHDDTKFTQTTFIGKKAADNLSKEDLIQVKQDKREIDEMMHRYMR